MTADDAVAGRVAPGYETVREAFAGLLADGRQARERTGPDDSGGETGAALTVLRYGEPVVTLHGGWRDTARRQPWTADTLVNTYSVAKPFVAAAVLMLVDRGRLDLDDRVTDHWPAFAARGKTAVTVRHLLTHTAGLPAFPVPRTADAYGDWDLLCADLAAATPEFAPGEVAAEHALTYGHLLGELVRRIDGRSPGRFVAEEIAVPWRLDLGFGLTPADRARCAELEYGDPDWPVRALGTPGSLHHRALANPAGALDLGTVNGDAWRSAEVPAVNMHATATGIARFYAGLLAGGTLDGVRLLDPSTVVSAVAVQHDGPDLMLQRPVRWGLGVQIEDDGSWGMGGVGGSAGWADPATGHAIAYVTRRLGGFDRVEAVEAALAFSAAKP
jgi:CubicO group peptidase (beta-lactamase class C family)